MLPKRQYYISVIILGIIIGRWMMRNDITEASALIATIVTLTLYVLLLLYIAKKYGIRSLWWVLALSLLGITLEYTAIQTCFPYGCFQYTPLVGPRFMGTFPWSLIAIRPILVVTISQLVKKRSWNNQWKSIISIALLLVFTDIFLDPVAVQQNLRTYTSWLSVSRYNVPLTNYLWRLITGTISARVLRSYSPRITNDPYLQWIGLLIMVMYITARITIIFS
jgi:uncharacterized membrane protein